MMMAFSGHQMNELISSQEQKAIAFLVDMFLRVTTEDPEQLYLPNDQEALLFKFMVFVFDTLANADEPMHEDEEKEMMDIWPLFITPGFIVHVRSM